VGTAGKVRAGSVLVICLFVSGAFSLRGTDAAPLRTGVGAGAGAGAETTDLPLSTLTIPARNAATVHIYIFPDGQVAVAHR
jgi:hypothetical protein